ncbi:MAG: RsmE family RNA methyltransferase [Acidimicrobiales bacterium]
MTAKAHVFVGDPEQPVVDDADRHHLARVLRLRPGDEVTVSDGAGRWRLCRWTGGAVEPTGDPVTEPAPARALTVAFALTKGERPEWVVQKLTELGIDRIVAFRAERSVVRWTPDRAAAQVERWRRIAREAASQSRRVWLPVVEDVTAFADLLARPGAVLASADGGPPSPDHGVVLIGPEGGWSDAELAEASAAGVPRVALGPHILRAETAATTAGALLAALRAGLVSPQS